VLQYLGKVRRDCSSAKGVIRSLKIFLTFSHHLSQDLHNLIDPLGRNTGASIDKGSLCTKLGHTLVPFSSVCSPLPPPLGYAPYSVLPGCAAYVPLETVEYFALTIDGEADHDVVILKPVGEPMKLHDDILTTGELRERNII
jgi:hypothetical protein